MISRRDPGYRPYQPNRLERAYDKALGIFAPKAAFQNQIYREQRHAFGYEGARIGRERKNATRAGTITSNTPLNASDRLQLVWEARDLAMNDCFIHGLLDKFAHYVVGPKIRIEVITGNQSDDHQLEDWLYECMDNCDLTERSKYTDYTRLVLMSVIRDGDIGNVYQQVPSDSFVNGRRQEYIRLQPCETDVIGGYHYWIEHNVVSGVEFDTVTGKPLNYRIYPRNNYGYYSADYTAVPAHQFNFLSYRQRTDQYRGVSCLAPAIPTARDIKEILENERLGVKWSNSWAGFVTTGPGDAAMADPSNVYSAPAPGNLPITGAGGGFQTQQIFYENFEPGQIGYLGFGEKVESAKTDRPSSTFNGFAALLIRQICCSMNVPFGFAFDTSILGGTPARLESAQAKRTFEWWQALLDDNFHQQNFKRWTAHGIISGRVRLKSLNRMPIITVSAPAHPTVDVGRESKANVSEYEAGLKTFSEIVQEQGRNPRAEIERLANDAAQMIETANRRGIPLEMISPQKVASPIVSKGIGSGGGAGGGGSSASDAGIGAGLSRRLGELEERLEQLVTDGEDQAIITRAARRRK